MATRLLLPRGFHLSKSKHLLPRLTRPLQTYSSPLLKSPLRISPEVADALATNRPIVALETTIYTHGALGDDLNVVLEDLIRSKGAVPAVCGVLAGVPTVGLTSAEVDRMVKEGARKVSRRDLAYLVGMVSTPFRFYPSGQRGGLFRFEEFNRCLGWM
jgi:hypothetical protein